MRCKAVCSFGGLKDLGLLLAHTCQAPDVNKYLWTQPKHVWPLDCQCWRQATLTHIFQTLTYPHHGHAHFTHITVTHILHASQSRTFYTHHGHAHSTRITVTHILHASHASHTHFARITVTHIFQTPTYPHLCVTNIVHAVLKCTFTCKAWLASTNCFHLPISTHAHTYTYTHTHARIHTHARTCTHTHAYTA